ncbi:hypothetical protein FACS1894102_2120 [Spirochaetia bacterium]|nr:hypothetical protein FACS1894102_2120 [Spirochaetia bacterium]
MKQTIFSQNKKVFIPLCVIIIVSSIVLYHNSGNIRLNPLRFSNMLDWCIYACGNGERLAISGNSKQSVVVLDKNKKRIYRLDANNNEHTLFSNAMLLTLDNDNNLYVKDINYSGFFNKNVERILKYDPTGKFINEIYRYTYVNEDYLFTKEKISDIKYHDNFIYFLRTERDGFYLERVPTNKSIISSALSDSSEENGKAQVLLFKHYPDALYELKYFHINAETKRLTTVKKNGSILQYDFTGNETGVWPVVQGTFPCMAVSDINNDIIFSDVLTCQIVKINTVTNEREVFYKSQDGYRFEEINYTNGTVYTTPSNKYVLILDENGTAERIDSYKFSVATIIIRCLLLITVLADILASLLLIINIILYLIPRTQSKTAKQMKLALLSILVGSSVAGSLIVHDSTGRLSRIIYSNLENISRMISSTIDTDILKDIDGPGHWDTESYQALRNNINYLFSRNNFGGQIMYLHLWFEKDGIIYSMYDSESLFGCFYPFDTYEGQYYEEVFETGKYIRATSKIASGAWLYACGPVYDIEGNIAAFIETGNNLTLIDEKNKRQMIKTIIKVILALIVLFLTVSTYIVLYERKKSSLNKAKNIVS